MSSKEPEVVYVVEKKKPKKKKKKIVIVVYSNGRQGSNESVDEFETVRVIAPSLEEEIRPIVHEWRGGQLEFACVSARTTHPHGVHV